jgi:hypothetical protein
MLERKILTILAVILSMEALIREGRGSNYYSEPNKGICFENELFFCPTKSTLFQKHEDGPQSFWLISERKGRKLQPLYVHLHRVQVWWNFDGTPVAVFLLAPTG